MPIGTEKWINSPKLNWTSSKTLVSSLTQEALWRSLDALTDAVYTELERYDERACIIVNRQQVNEYINACRNIEQFS